MLTVNDCTRGLVRGRIAVGSVFLGPNMEPMLMATYKPNQIQLTWGVIAARQIGYKRQAHRPDYSISAMYIEFENVADPLDAVTIPTFDRTEGLEYYDALSVSGTRDFVRVPLRMEPGLSVNVGDEADIPEGQGNMLSFFAMTSAATGVHGKTFSNGANSKICGVALVSTPEFADRTQDVIFARTYLELADQQVKDVSAQAGVAWDIIFG